MTSKQRRRLVRFISMAGIYIILSVVSFIIIFPYVWMVLASLRTTGAEIWSTSLSDLIPRSITLDSYLHLEQIQGTSLWIMLKNSIVYSVGATLVNATVCTLAAYALAAKRVPGSQAILLFFLCMMVIPQEVVAIPLFLVVRTLHMLYTAQGVILVLSAEAISILILYRFFIELPKELTDAAMIDGAGDIQLLLHIVLPLARPAIGTVVLLQFIMAWNSFMLPLILANKPALYNLQVAMAAFNTQWAVDFRAIMAVGSIITVPVLLIFAATQGTLIRGITAGAIKG